MSEILPRNPRFWDILNAIVKGVPLKQIEHQFEVPYQTIANYKQRFIETTVRIKDNVVDDNQLRFPFAMPAKRLHEGKVTWGMYEKYKRWRDS